MPTRAPRILALCLSSLALLAMLRCVSPPTGARYLCEPDGSCPEGEVCIKAECWPMAPDAARYGADAAEEPDAGSAGEDAGPVAGKDASAPRDAAPACAPDAAVTAAGTDDGDTFIIATGDNWGASTIVKVGPGGGRGLVRFATSAEVAQAFADGRVRSLTLTLTRAQYDNTCNATGCPAAAGDLTAYSLRTDWVEGHGNSDAVTWSQIGDADGTPWGSLGADQKGVDHGASAGTATVGLPPSDGGTEAPLKFPLDPTAFEGGANHPDPWVDATGEIAILLVADTTAQYTFASKEDSSAGPDGSIIGYAPPQLQVVYCP